MSGQASNRSVRVDGNIQGGVIQTGDENVASVQHMKTTLPPAQSVDIEAELSALRELLSDLNAPDQKKIVRAAEDCDDELAKPDPDKEEVGAAVERMLKYASQAAGFAEIVSRITAHVTNIVGWLGSGWSKLLSFVGLST